MLLIIAVPVGKLGYYLPWAVGGAVLNAIASGLLSTLSPSSNMAKIIGYQIILGVGRGIGMQVVCVTTSRVQPYLPSC